MNKSNKLRPFKSPCGGFRGLLLATAMLVMFNGCRDMLDTDSDRLVFDDAYDLNNPNATYVAIAGILTELQQVADRYVLLGELRGDLMRTSEGATVALKQINNFEVVSSAENEYADKHAYYNIINNCNYAIQKMDTSLTVQTEKVMLPAYAEIKTIRAWTYFQLAQIFGKVVYLTEPVMDLTGSLVAETPIGLDELVDKLITDLTPYINLPIVSPNMSPDPFMPAALLLGDLHLYAGHYPEAARMYYRIMQTGEIYVSDASNRWLNTAGDGVSIGHTTTYYSEQLAVINFKTEAKDLHSKLINLSFNDRPGILPSINFVEAMSTAEHYYTSASNGSGTVFLRESDLRGNIQMRNTQIGDAYFYVNTQYSPQQEPLINKYIDAGDHLSTGADPDNELLTNGIGSRSGGLYYLTQVPVVRVPHLYLRYAEAVNRANKPTLAFAVLKYGLKSATTDTTARKVNPAELDEDYTNFTGDIFDYNTAMAVRGRGYGIQSPTVYNIPDFTDSPTAKQDSTEWIEDRILEELAAETAFEGNRFFDLLCISRNRGGAAWMAAKVAAKYPDAGAMEAKLQTLESWFLP